MLEQLLKDCIAACKLALKKCETMSGNCKANLAICITACEQAQSDPDAVSACCQECFEAASCLSSYKDDCCKAAEIACTSCGVACRQVMYRSEKHRICRYIKLDASKIDRAKQTLPISFSSEYPAMQRSGDEWPEIFKEAGIKRGQAYVEILDHDPANVDLSLLKNRGAFLDEHDEKDQLGVVEEVEVADKTGRAVIRMGSDDKAKLRFTQMADDVRPHISVGAKYTRYVGAEKLPNGRTAHRFAWKALEISSVAAPADPNVGVARSYQDLPEESPQVDSPKTPKAQDAPIVMPEKTEVMIDEKQVRKEAAAGYKNRAKEITTVADALIIEFGERDGGEMGKKIRSMANDSLAGEHCDEPVNDFKLRCMTDILKAKPVEPVGLRQVTDDPNAYSIQRGIQSAIRRAEKGKCPQTAAIPDGLEGEVHTEIMRRSAGEPGGLGFEPAGFLVPHDATLGGTKLLRSERNRMTRDSQATIFPAGGAFVPTELRIPVIEVLRNVMVLDRAGYCMTLAGLAGNIVIPRQEATATAYSVGEIDQLTASQQILGQISLSPKRVGSKQIYSKQFVMQSTPDAEGFIRQDHFEVIARQWDRLGLVGQGAGDEPLGIFNTPGCQSIIFGGTPTWIQIVAMETALRVANVNDELVYISTPATKGSLKTRAVALTGATVIGGAQNAIWVGQGLDGEMNGYPALDSNQIPGNVVMLGAKNQAIKALWGGLDIVTDIYTRADRAEIVLTMNTWGDFACRHPQAFIVSADAGNQ